MHEKVVRTWNELQRELYDDSWNAELGRFRSKCAFRGLSDAGYRLETTLMRLSGRYSMLEHHLLRNFKKYAYRDVMSGNSIWHCMAVAQHFGLPTRLLDWTYSPFCALHFATSDLDKFDTDGVVWAVNYVRAHKLLPEVLRVQLEREGANVFTMEMLSESLRSLQELGKLCEGPFVLFFEPPSMDDRIVNQFAFFSVMSDPELVLDDWIERHRAVARKIIIPSGLKWEIRDKLDQANITERVLFPGLEGLSKWLKRHYSPKRGSDSLETEAYKHLISFPQKASNE